MTTASSYFLPSFSFWSTNKFYSITFSPDFVVRLTMSPFLSRLKSRPELLGVPSIGKLTQSLKDEREKSLRIRLSTASNCLLAQLPSLQGHLLQGVAYLLPGYQRLRTTPVEMQWVDYDGDRQYIVSIRLPRAQFPNVIARGLSEGVSFEICHLSPKRKGTSDQKAKASRSRLAGDHYCRSFRARGSVSRPGTSSNGTQSTASQCIAPAAECRKGFNCRTSTRARPCLCSVDAHPRRERTNATCIHKGDRVLRYNKGSGCISL